MADISEYVTLAQAAKILEERGTPLDAVWLRKKCSDGKIDGAVKIGEVWLVLRSWAQTYVKDTRGRPKTK